MKQKPRIISDSELVNARLSELGLCVEGLLEAVRASMVGRYDAVQNDPIGTPGLRARQLGTRSLRDTYLDTGWARDTQSNIDSIRHLETGAKVVFQNAERQLCRVELPRAASAKGRGSRELVESPRRQGHMSRLFALGQNPFDPPDSAWEIAGPTPVNAAHYLFVHVTDDGEVTAELATPYGVGEDGNFDEFYERIYLIEAGDQSWSIADDFRDDHDGESGQKLAVEVTRK